MTDTEETPETLDAQDETTAAVDTNAVSSEYKVLGHNTTTSGTTYGVLGQVDSPDGYGLYTPDDAKIDGTTRTPTVDAPAGTALTLSTDAGARTLRLGHPVADPYGNTAGGTVVGGYQDNSANQAVGATIGGGGSSGSGYALGTDRPHTNEVLDDFGTVGGGKNNRAGTGDSDPTSAQHATVAGGYGNTANGTEATVGGGRSNMAGAEYATVGGGYQNEALTRKATVGGGADNVADTNGGTVAGGISNKALDHYSTVAGGLSNTANGYGATVPGGYKNTASGANSIVAGGSFNQAGAKHAFAAGYYARAANNHAFVWNDGSAYHDVYDNGTVSGLRSDKDVDGSNVNGAGTFHVSAQGGVRFLTAASAVTYIPGGSAGWTTTSSRTAKTNIDPVDPKEALTGVESLDVATWEYEDDDGDGAGVTHIGPMAEEFHEAFDVGDSDEHINSVNADGVAFAAIQGLAAELEDTSNDLEETRAELNDTREDLDEAHADLAAKEDRIDEVVADNEALRAETSELRDRLAALEARVGTGSVDGNAETAR